MKRRTFLTAGLAGPLAMSPWLAGCGGADEMSLAIHPWIGYETLFLAREFGWLPAALKMRETGDLNESALSLRSGEVDAACVTLDELLRLRSEGVQVTAALVFDISAGADAVLARPEIASVDQLAGRRIGVEPGPLGSILLHRMLGEVKIAVDRVTVVPLPTSEQLAAWKKGDVDAVISYEPVSTLLQREGAVRIFDTRRLPDTIMDILAVRTERMSALRAPLKALVAAHFQALRHLQTNRQDAIHRIATREKIEIDEVSRALAGIIQPSLAANYEYLVSGQGRLRESASSLSLLMLEIGLVKARDPLIDLTSTVGLPDESGGRRG